MDTKRVGIVATALPSITHHFINRAEGVLSVAWTPVARLVTTADAPLPQVLFNEQYLSQNGLDKETLIAEYKKLATSGAALDEVQWR